MSDPLVVNHRITIPAAELSYEFSRSGGPGGQHVNTTDTRVRLRFELSKTRALSSAVKARLRNQHPAWTTVDGALHLTSDASRSQRANVETVRRRLAEAIRAALIPPKTRKATKPSRRAKARRVDAKKKRGELKSSRKKVDYRGD